MALSRIQRTSVVAGFETRAAERGALHRLLTREVGGLDQGTNKIAAYSGPGLPVRGALEPRMTQIGAWDYTISTKPWKQGLEITDKQYTQDILGKLASMPGQMVDKWILAYDAFVAALIEAGGGTTYSVPYSSATGLFATDHAYPQDCPNKTAWNNAITASQVPAADIADGTYYVPTVDEWILLLAEVRNYAQLHYLDPNGDRLFTGREPVTIIVPGGRKETTAKQAFSLPTVSAGGANIGTSMGVAGILGDSALTTATYVYFYFAGIGDAPFIHAWRKMVDGGHYLHKMTVPGSVTDVHGDTTHWVTSSDEDIIAGDPRGIIRVTLS